MVGKYQLSFDLYFEIICFGLSNQWKLATEERNEGALPSDGNGQLMKFITGVLTPVIAIEEVILKKSLEDELSFILEDNSLGDLA